jgi:hypothetical protein
MSLPLVNDYLCLFQCRFRLFIWISSTILYINGTFCGVLPNLRRNAQNNDYIPCPWAYGPNLVWRKAAQYWFARPLCIMLHSTHIQLCSRVMFCPNDTWISAQLPDLKHFFLGGRLCLCHILWSKPYCKCSFHV